MLSADEKESPGFSRGGERQDVFRAKSAHHDYCRRLIGAAADEVLADAIQRLVDENSALKRKVAALEAGSSVEGRLRDAGAVVRVMALACQYGSQVETIWDARDLVVEAGLPGPLHRAVMSSLEASYLPWRTQPQ